MKITLQRPRFLDLQDFYDYIRSRVKMPFSVIGFSDSQINVLLKETWKQIPGYTNYIVSDCGRVKNKLKGNILKNCTASGDGRERVCIRSDEGKKGPVLVHRLVALAFLKQIEGKTMVLHRDGNHLNNFVWNLYWGDQMDNHMDSVRHGTFNLPRKRNEEKYQRIYKLFQAGITRQEAANITDVSYSTVKRYYQDFAKAN